MHGKSSRQELEVKCVTRARAKSSRNELMVKLMVRRRRHELAARSSREELKGGVHWNSNEVERIRIYISGLTERNRGI